MMVSGKPWELCTHICEFYPCKVGGLLHCRRIGLLFELMFLNLG